jgi:hypothetical protein
MQRFVHQDQATGPLITHVASDYEFRWSSRSKALASRAFRQMQSADYRTGTGVAMTTNNTSSRDIPRRRAMKKKSTMRIFAFSTSHQPNVLTIGGGMPQFKRQNDE